MVQEVKSGQEDQRYLLVRSGALKYALPVSDVVRVVRGLISYPVPGSEARLLGLSQYGGEPLPVLDLHAVVEGNPSASRYRSTVILGRGQPRDRPLLGLAVDDVLQVVSLASETVIFGESGITADAVIGNQRAKILNTRHLLEDGTNDMGAING
jgi:chemotaxis signal transduction protein